jgi:hypothetical protein
VTFTVKRDSWHYRWLLWYSATRDIDYYDAQDLVSLNAVEKNFMIFDRLPTDFCAYWRRVLLWPAIRIGLNLLCYVPLGVAIAVTGVSGLAGLGWVLASAVTLGLFGLVLGAGMWAIDAVKKKFTRKTARNGDEFIAHVAESMHGKFCSRVEYEEKSDA